jgi:hypothetical protein
VKRVELIRGTILNLDNFDFEDFVVELLSRDLYPGLNPTSSSGDMGEDARTERSTLFLHDGIYLSLAISKECSWRKIKQDCNRCKKTKRKIDLMVFVTTGSSTSPRETTIEKWKNQVKEIYGWDLEVRTINFLAPFASRHAHEDIADQYLHVPPVGGDFLQNIERSFENENNRALRNISISLPGVDKSIRRDEIKRIEDQIQLGKFVLLVGDAGSGKSGIAFQLAKNTSKSVIFLDARRLGETKSNTDFRNHFDLNGDLGEGIMRLASAKGCRIIIDQLDNSIGLPVSDLLIDLVFDVKYQDGVEVIIISRKREAHEKQFLKKLSPDKGFVELNSNPLSEELVKSLLHEIGISSPSQIIIEMGKNLLNLEIISRIVQENPTIDISKLNSEVDLWGEYISVIKIREGNHGDAILSEAIKLATLGIQAEDRSFTLDVSRPLEQQRLESWKIIVRDYGRVYRFHHEKLQDYLYAFDATERGLTKDDVINELGDTHRTRNIYLMMRDIYERNTPSRLPQYLREAWNV